MIVCAGEDFLKCTIIDGVVVLMYTTFALLVSTLGVNSLVYTSRLLLIFRSDSTIYIGRYF